MTRLVLAIVVLAGVPRVSASQEATGGAATFFELKIRPVLMGTCFKCHGGDKVNRKLRVDSRESLVTGGEGGATIVPGKPDQSLLIRAIGYHDEDLQMPPKKRLPEDVVADFARWIRDGAHWPQTLVTAPVSPPRHWSFEPISSVAAPTNAWSTHPVDGFIRLRQKRRQIHPGDPADKWTLIRRASFDLVGLPPSRGEVEAFIHDERPGAFARAVDRLLASPRYGERWGRHWLDLVRYADTAGENSDYPIPEAYLYRDYVIDAFNADKPYDQFLHEQIAGDILANEAPDEKFAQRVIATGFVAQAKRFGTRKLEDMHLIIEDTVHTMGQVVLGLTLRCARCHDHKYDPVTMEDYYALYGFFSSTAYPFPGGEEVKRPSEFARIVSDGDLAQQDAAYAAKYGGEIARIKSEIEKVSSQGSEAEQVKKLVGEIKSTQETLKSGGGKAASDELKARLAQLNKQQTAARKQLDAKLKPLRGRLAGIENAKPSKRAPVAYAVREGKAGDAAIQKGGDPNKKGKAVPRGVPRFLGPQTELEIPTGRSGRLQLARWLTSGASHLTARVMVNRIWQHHFGKPLVATPSDFGLRGEAPSHPDLLDWLARDFIDSGWSVKHMHRRIMSSKTYQLASKDHAGNAAIDDGNRSYWRFDRRRLDAESLRDSMLALGGHLDLARPGRHPFPPVNKWGFTAHHQFKAVYPSKHRSVYLMVQRLHPHPYLALFNGPDTSSSTAVRDQSTVALQSLFMLNSDFVHKQAEGLAAQLIKAATDPRERIRLAFERAYARPPSEDEIGAVVGYSHRYLETLVAEKVAPNQRELQAWSSIARSLLTSNEFMYVN